LRVARDAIAIALGARGVEIAPPDLAAGEGWLQEPAATFVTLTRLGHLHGCIGSIEPRRTLFEDVRHNAVSAALYDPRAVPLRLADLDDLRIEVSLLSPLARLEFESEEDALAKLRPHRDGVVFAYGGQRATFLPQVWDSLPTPHEFMAHLKLKAGFPGDFWSSAVRLSRYSLQKWSDDDPTAPDRLELQS
jgi:hypothetical protein